MRTFATVVALSFLVATAFAATSSSTSASASKSTSVSASYSYSDTWSSTGYTGACTPGAGGDAPCVAFDS